MRDSVIFEYWFALLSRIEMVPKGCWFGKRMAKPPHPISDRGKLTLMEAGA
jgi:hypothetical protein